MTTLYGIKNCDTVRKARRWLEEHDIAYHFHDFREDGLTTEQVQLWLESIGRDALINKRSTTWKSIPEEQKASLNDAFALALILQHPTLIKRPLLELNNHYYLGFKAADYLNYFR